jgi:hypothetical protein
LLSRHGRLLPPSQADFDDEFHDGVPSDPVLSMISQHTLWGSTGATFWVSRMLNQYVELTGEANMAATSS